MVNHVIFCGAWCSILDVATIFCNQIRMFLWRFQQNFHGIGICSMESKVDMPAFHMESGGIHVEPVWNPCGINHSILIPHGIHDVYGFHMDSIRNNLGKVKTLEQEEYEWADNGSSKQLHYFFTLRSELCKRFSDKQPNSFSM